MENNLFYKKKPLTGISGKGKTMELDHEKYIKKEYSHKHILRDNALSGYSEKAKNELRKCLEKAKRGVTWGR